MPDDGQIVRDEDIGEVELVLEALQEVDDLGLDGDVQRGDRFVGDDDLRPEGQTAGDADALALAAGELVRIAVDVLGVEADDVEEVPSTARTAPTCLRKTTPRVRG